ncbi:hypothetical protein [Geodermatophilus sp. DSM 45219]|uniref:hypothetical protein n=1 Tax=Geodermatophilus sp. DSM 45219 TaxID=1881103 RepID=UPI0008807D01|nr:hypothetical protein [Geodermatophilus sp. DSM 45219]SDO37771.1 hypothetical protein SAMN05428965_3806 [Geodermatophilus sp. DSM 45219]
MTGPDGEATPTPRGEAFALHAWVDERMDVDLDQDRGRYILASVVCDPSGCDPVRQAVRGLLQGRQRRLHWRDEIGPWRTKIAATIGALDMTAVVVVEVSMANRRQERARRLCMEALLPSLERDYGVSLEARTQTLTSKDREHVANLVGKRLIIPALRADSARPPEEPMPDAVAGAVGADRLGDPEWLDIIGQKV